MPSWLVPLAWLYAQTAAMSVLFVLAGALAVCPEPWRQGSDRQHPALVWGRGYFVGVSAALALFVPLARVLGSARHGLTVTLACLLAAVILARVRRPGTLPSGRALAGTLAGFVVLVAVFSLTNLVCWTNWQTSGPTTVLHARHHLGSIHAGRYANYALLIDTENRIPFLAQNMGQSILAAFNLLLGVRGPLAALMVWLPCSLAALALMLYGTLRARGLTRAWSAAGSFFVLFCNVGLDRRALFVFDSGSPLGFIGYTDLLLGIGTFLVLASWLESGDASGRSLRTLLPGLLGLTWCWYAPQNIALVIPVLLAACWARRSPGEAADRRPVAIWTGAAILAGGIVAGSIQLGSLLPRSLQEDTNLPTVAARSGVTLRPYALLLSSHWSEPRWNVKVAPDAHPVLSPQLYEQLERDRRTEGGGGLGAAVASLIAGHLASSLRVYFFPLAGLLLLAFARRRCRTTSAGERFWIALGAFGSGWAIAFLFEYGGMKWWLTRFLVPGTALCLLWGFEALADGLSHLTARVRWSLLAALLVVATYGPLAELAWVCRENLVRAQAVDPISRRLELLVTLRGFFRDARSVPAKGSPEPWQ